MKGEDRLTWKTHNTEACKSKKYYEKEMSNSSDSPSIDYKRSKKATTKKTTD